MLQLFDASVQEWPSHVLLGSDYSTVQGWTVIIALASSGMTLAAFLTATDRLLF